jgi:hypothetical protein
VPDGHCYAGLEAAADSQSDWAAQLEDILRIDVGKHKPKSAYVAVRYHGYWYSIDDADAASKTTINLLNDLFRLLRIGAAEGQPVLTLPVGR